jgi:hypothetical protein
MRLHAQKFLHIPHKGKLTTVIEWTGQCADVGRFVVCHIPFFCRSVIWIQAANTLAFSEVFFSVSTNATRRELKNTLMSFKGELTTVIEWTGNCVPSFGRLMLSLWLYWKS